MAFIDAKIKVYSKDFKWYVHFAIVQQRFLLKKKVEVGDVRFDSAALPEVTFEFIHSGGKAGTVFLLGSTNKLDHLSSYAMKDTAVKIATNLKERLRDLNAYMSDV